MGCLMVLYTERSNAHSTIALLRTELFPLVLAVTAKMHICKRKATELH